MSRRKGRKNFAGVGNYNFCYFLYFCGTIKIGTIKYYPHEIIMSRRKSRNGRKGCAEGDEDFLYFFYFCGTKKYYPHGILIVPQKGQKELRGGR